MSSFGTLDFPAPTCRIAAELLLQSPIAETQNDFIAAVGRSSSAVYKSGGISTASSIDIIEMEGFGDAVFVCLALISIAHSVILN